MPKGIAKKKPAAKFFVLNADKYLSTPQIVGSPEENKLEQMRAKRLRRRLAKIEEMEADNYLSEVEDELKKKKGTKKKTEESTVQTDKLVKGLIENPQVQQQWITMDPQQRNMILATIEAIKSKGGESAGSLGGLMPLMFMQMQRKPDTSVTEMVQLINAVRPQQQPQVTIKDIIDLQKATQGQQSQTGMIKDVFSVLKPIYEQVSEKDRQLLLGQIANPLDTLKELKAFNESMGFTGANQNQQLAVQLEQMRGERELKIEELRQNRLQQERQFNMDQQNRRWDREDSKERWQMVQGVLEGPIGQGIGEMGRGAASRISGTPNQPVQPPKIPNPIPITCPNCNKQFVGSSDAVTVNCPHCGTQLKAVKQPETMASSSESKQPPESKKPIS